MLKPVTTLACAAAAAGILSAQQTPALSPEKIKRIEQVISIEMSRRSIPGLTVAIGQGPQVRWEGAYGLADLENMVPMTSSTVLRTASLAKPMTAVAAMQLVEAGKLVLDAPVQRYVPTFPQKPWPLNVRHLLCHQGGIRTYQGDEMQSTRHYRDNIDALKIFQGDPLLFEPGTRVAYSTYGFSLLGAVIEGAAGVDYADYIRERVFKPAKMTATDVDDVFKIVPHRAHGYYQIGRASCRERV